MGNSQRILIVNPFGIGDVLFTTPLIRAVRRAFPHSHIGYLCNRRTERLLQENPQLDELFVYEKDEMLELWRSSRLRGLGQLGLLLRRLRAARFNVLIDLSLSDRYSFVLKILGIRQRLGFDYRRRGRFLNERMQISGYQGEHVVDYYRRLLRFMGIHLMENELELHTRADERKWASQWLSERGLNDKSRLVGLVPAGGVSWGFDAAFRRWGAEGFAAVGDALIERCGVKIILFGESADKSVCQTVVRLMRYPAIDASGKTTLGQFIGLLSELDLVVCNDGGPLHLAVSQGIRTVSIFGPVDPDVYGPYPDDGARHNVICHEELMCRPCYHRFRLPPCPYERACLTHVEAEDVIQACELAMQEGQKAQSVHV